MPRGVYDRSKAAKKAAKSASSSSEKVTKRKYTRRASTQEATPASGGADNLTLLASLTNVQGTFIGMGPAGKEFAERNARRLNAIAEQLWPTIEQAEETAPEDTAPARAARAPRGSGQAPAPFAPPSVPQA